MNNSVVVYTSVCEDDRRWVPQYLAEMERLGTPFIVNFDRCGDSTKRQMLKNWCCVGSTSQDDWSIEFEEGAKQPLLNMAVKLGYTWGMPLDIDETLEKSAPDKLPTILASQADFMSCIWVNLWNDPQHVRVDGGFFRAKREKFYRLGSHVWRYTTAVVNGPKAMCRKTGRILEPGEASHVQTDLVCLHWGLMTEELRREHKARWDRIYTAAVGGNPYGFWDWCLDSANHPATVERNPYL